MTNFKLNFEQLFSDSDLVPAKIFPAEVSEEIIDPY